MKQLPRPYMSNDRGRTTKYIDVCQCHEKERRGPEGGVCGNCGKAIPTSAELKAGAGIPLSMLKR